MATHGSLTKAGKVRGQTPKVEEQTQNCVTKVITINDLF